MVLIMKQSVTHIAWFMSKTLANILPYIKQASESAWPVTDVQITLSSCLSENASLIYSSG